MIFHRVNTTMLSTRNDISPSLTCTMYFLNRGVHGLSAASNTAGLSIVESINQYFGQPACAKLPADEAIFTARKVFYLDDETIHPFNGKEGGSFTL
jgi:hypothetical protein